MFAQLYKYCSTHDLLLKISLLYLTCSIVQFDDSSKNVKSFKTTI